MEIRGLCLLCSFYFCFATPSEYTLATIDWHDATLPFTDAGAVARSQMIIARELALEAVNQNENILPNTVLSLDVVQAAINPPLAIEAMINFSANNQTLVIGNPTSITAESSAVVGTVLGIAQLSYMATSPKLSDEMQYPYFSRLTTNAESQLEAMKATVLYYSEIQGAGWTDVGIISSSDDFGLTLSASLIEISKPELDVISYRQFISEGLTGLETSENTGMQSELRELKNSNARVLFAFVFEDWEVFITAANEEGLIGDEYVWFVPNSVVAIQFATEEVRELSRGLIGYFQYFPITDQVINFIIEWSALDPIEYPGAGPDIPPSPFTFLVYDGVITAARALHELDMQGILDEEERISPELWTNTIRNITFEGLSGPIEFDSRGDRISGISILYYNADAQSWLPTALWHPDTGYTHENDIIWHSNTTEIPDLDIREPFDYWSCHNKEERTDQTGKTIERHTPDGSDIDDIDSEYYCDQFIDCHNLSDEGFGCESNYIVLFIVFGIITGILMLITLLLLVFVIVFGVILKYRRLRVASPFFLLVLLLSIFVGYSSVFTWFGKPHPVACGFQPWLLGLPVLSMISALSVKTFRVWRIFKFPMKKTRISNLELFVMWLCSMIPATLIVLLWTIISTPTAKMEERNGREHYVCTTGGFTGEPGGIIFFFIFIAYGAVILLLGAFVSILVRAVPSQFNESKLVAISIYNLSLLSVVIIPVYMVVVLYNPFIAWILRTIAILYAFTATLVLQFLSKLIGIFIVDKGRNKRVFVSALKSTISTPSQSEYK